MTQDMYSQAQLSCVPKVAVTLSAMHHETIA